MRIVGNRRLPYRPMPTGDLEGCEMFSFGGSKAIRLMTERLDIDVPATADPLCCYMRTVIFYARPPARADEICRVDHVVGMDDMIEDNAGQMFVVKAGRVRWSIDHWEMVWTLYREETRH